ncbi:UrcA family protein [Novosphingobium terrae]|uniref:UrcA family protein n=1 Tax=Novosphingobium terrae TaxID=2726189 RepID=UPI001981FD58|nr:UrcA family protein [Novosphingobium terrae]
MIFRIFATLSLAVATPALATAPESMTRAVHVSDLDLSTPSGARMLQHRVAAALEAVCGSYEGTQSSGGAQEADAITQCRLQARTQIGQRLAALMTKNQLSSAR